MRKGRRLELGGEEEMARILDSNLSLATANSSRDSSLCGLPLPHVSIQDPISRAATAVGTNTNNTNNLSMAAAEVESQLQAAAAAEMQQPSAYPRSQTPSFMLSNTSRLSRMTSRAEPARSNPGNEMIQVEPASPLPHKQRHGWSSLSGSEGMSSENRTLPPPPLHLPAQQSPNRMNYSPNGRPESAGGSAPDSPFSNKLHQQVLTREIAAAKRATDDEGSEYGGDPSRITPTHSVVGRSSSGFLSPAARAMARQIGARLSMEGSATPSGGSFSGNPLLKHVLQTQDSFSSVASDSPESPFCGVSRRCVSCSVDAAHAYRSKLENMLASSSWEI